MAKALFGQEHFAKGLILMKAAADGSIQSMSASLYEQGYAAKVATEQTNNLSGDLKGLNSAYEEVAISLYDTVAPALREIVQGLTGAVRAVARVSSPAADVLCSAGIAGGPELGGDEDLLARHA